MATKESSDLAESVRTVAEAWDRSPYYADAENWTRLFWDEHTIYRRLFDTLDLEATLELACGHGRHAERCADKCGSLILMDIFEENLEVCRARLADKPQVRTILNDGASFHPLTDESLTAIYCYDAMVHFSEDIVASYLEETFRVLRPQGRALYHHSNYSAGNTTHYGANPHARNIMTSERFQSLARAAGLDVVESVVTGWGGVDDLDCVSLLQRPA